jgi:hypothetical protein
MGNVPQKLKNAPDGLKGIYAKLDDDDKKEVEVFAKTLGTPNHSHPLDVQPSLSNNRKNRSALFSKSSQANR